MADEKKDAAQEKADQEAKKAKETEAKEAEAKKKEAEAKKAQEAAAMKAAVSSEKVGSLSPHLAKYLDNREVMLPARTPTAEEQKRADQKSMCHLAGDLLASREVQETLSEAEQQMANTLALKLKR